MTEEAITAVLAEFDALIDKMQGEYDESYSGDYYGATPYGNALAEVEEWRDTFAAKHGRPLASET